MLPFGELVELTDHLGEGQDEDLGPLRPSDARPTDAGMTRPELLEATGLSDTQLDALVSFGLVSPTGGEGAGTLYDDEALTVAEIAADFARRGIEARHLKMYQHSAEREAALFAQVLVPYVRQRNPAGRARTQEELEALAHLGRRLRNAMLRRAMRRALIG